jgi:enoyl-CoA hydratase/carnithine racemase
MTVRQPATCEDLIVTLADGVAEVVLNRPAKHNALSTRMRDDLAAVLAWASEEPEVRAVTLCGAGPSFCAGQDLREPRGPYPGARVALWTRVHGNLAAAVASCAVPTVAGLHGHVLGRGLDVALAADLRIAAEGTRLGYPEVDHAMVVGGGGARRLVRMVGEGRAMEMLLCARVLDAETALAWGLVAKVVPTVELEDEVARLARSLTARSDLVLYAAKTGVRQATDVPEDAGAWMDTLFNVLSSAARRPDGPERGGGPGAT